jgi:hypothetical protein
VEDLHPGNVVWDLHTGLPVYIDLLITFQPDSVDKEEIVRWIRSHSSVVS